MEKTKAPLGEAVKSAMEQIEKEEEKKEEVKGVSACVCDAW